MRHFGGSSLALTFWRVIAGTFINEIWTIATDFLQACSVNFDFCTIIKKQTRSGLWIVPIPLNLSIHMGKNAVYLVPNYLYVEGFNWHKCLNPPTIQR